MSTPFYNADYCSLTQKEIRKITETQLRYADYGSVFVRGHARGIPYYVGRGYASIVAYIYIPEEVSEQVGDGLISVHGGVTYARAGGYGTVLGWDYAHSGDGMILPDLPGMSPLHTGSVRLQIGRAS